MADKISEKNGELKEIATHKVDQPRYPKVVSHSEKVLPCLSEKEMKERIETLDRIIDETKRIEVVMDIVNCDYGTQKEFCIFCKSDKYNSKVGIVHKENCEIIRMRKISKIKRSDENGD